MTKIKIVGCRYVGCFINQSLNKINELNFTQETIPYHANYFSISKLAVTFFSWYSMTSPELRLWPTYIRHAPVWQKALCYVAWGEMFSIASEVQSSIHSCKSCRNWFCCELWLRADEGFSLYPIEISPFRMQTLGYLSTIRVLPQLSRRPDDHFGVHSSKPFILISNFTNKEKGCHDHFPVL